jgi:outer membrane receptor protein involved in Fe transport
MFLGGQQDILLPPQGKLRIGAMTRIALLLAALLPGSLFAQEGQPAAESPPGQEAPTEPAAPSSAEAPPNTESGPSSESTPGAESPPADATRPEGMGEPTPAAPTTGELATIPVQEPAATPPPGPGEPTQLDELVVTAQKVKQPARRVPLSVTTLDGGKLTTVGAQNLADISLYIPNVRVDADDLGSPQVFIRGFGTNSFNPSFEASVGLVEDEVYFGRPGYFTESMFDIDRVEVLRGPQGTLFGKNCVAGVFNVSSREPDTDLSGDLNVLMGQKGEKRYEGGVGGMLTDWLGARVSGFKLDTDGDLHNTFLDRSEESRNQQAARAKLVVYPGFGLKSELMAVKSDTKAPFWALQLMNLDSDTRSFLQGYDPNVEDNPKDFKTEFGTPGQIDKGSTTYALKTDWDLDKLGPLHDFVPTLILAGSKFHIDQLTDLDVSPADISNLDDHEYHDQKTVELRIAGKADSLFGFGHGVEFVAGAFRYQSSYTLLAQVLAGQDLGAYTQTKDFCQLATSDPNSNPTGTGCTSSNPIGVPILGMPTAPLVAGDLYRFDYDQDVTSTALFGQATVYLTERIAVTPGVRINKEKKQVGAHGNGHCQAKDQNPGAPCFMEQLLKAEDYNEPNHRRSESDVDPKLALQYFAEHGINYYASWAKGYKSGGVNAVALIGTHPNSPSDTATPHSLEYEPEHAQTWELGAKGRFFDGTLETNLTLYRTNYENLQVLAFNGLLLDVSNAGHAKSRGLEMDFRWLTPWDALKLNGSAGLLDAKYVSYPGAPAPISQGIGVKQDLAGKTIAFAPKVTATLTPTLSYYLGSFVGSVAVDVLYQGDQYTDTDLDPNTHVPAYTKYAAHLSLTQPGGWWTVAVGGNNLTDVRVLNQVTDAPFFPGTYFAQQASGRQAFGTVTLSF